MWIFTPHGFYSAVEHREKPDTIIVRARDKQDLEALRPYIPDLLILETMDADYLYRIFVSRSRWASAVSTMAREIDYDNFKDAVKKRQGEDRASVYMRVWTAMLALQPWPFNGYYEDEYELGAAEPQSTWDTWRQRLGI